MRQQSLSKCFRKVYPSPQTSPHIYALFLQTLSFIDDDFTATPQYLTIVCAEALCAVASVVGPDMEHLPCNFRQVSCRISCVLSTTIWLCSVSCIQAECLCTSKWCMPPIAIQQRPMNCIIHHADHAPLAGYMYLCHCQLKIIMICVQRSLLAVGAATANFIMTAFFR